MLDLGKFQTLLRVIWDEVCRMRWLALSVAWAVCCVGWVGVMLLPDRYESNARIFVDTDTLIMPLMRGLTVQTDVDRQVEIMRKTLLTRPNIVQVIRNTDIDLEARTPADLERLVDVVQRKVKVGSDGKNLFQISYWDADPALAQRVVQSFLTLFVEQNMGKNRADMDSAQRFLDVQIAAFEKRLRETEGRVADFRREHVEELSGRQGIQASVELAITQLRHLQQELEAAVWNRDQLRVELARTPQQLSADRGPGGVSRTAELERQLAVLLATRTENHPDVVNLRRQIASMQKGGGDAAPSRRSVGADNPAWVQLNTELRKLETGIPMLERRVKDGAVMVNELRHKADEVPRAEIELQQLQRDYEVVKKNYEELLTRRESARLARSMEDQTKSVQFRIIEPPVAGNIPEGPPRVMLFGVVLAGGIGAGIGSALLMLLLRSPFTDTASLGDAFGVRVLGAITAIPRRINRTRATIEMSIFGVGGLSLVGLFIGLVYVYSQINLRPDALGAIKRLSGLVQSQFL